MATRASSGKTIQLLADNIPFLVGGSADLAPSNNTYMKSYDDIGKNSFTGKISDLAFVNLEWQE